MKKIKEILDIPLVLHGGTGLSSSIIKKSIQNGICKVNINTELQVEWSKAIREKLSKDSFIYDPRKIISSGEQNIKEVVANKIKLLGSYNKA